MAKSDESRGKGQKDKQQNQSGQPQGQSGQAPSSGRGMTPFRSGGMSRFGGGFEPFYRFREELNRMFDQFFPNLPGTSEAQGRMWDMQVQEDDNSVMIRAEAPGFEPADFDIQIRGDQLVLRASHKAETEEKERGYREWRQQEFYRSVPLPTSVDADKIEATYRNGVLHLTLPKSEQGKSKRIQVKT